MLILLDQDGVLADFDEGFRRAWRARHPDHSPVARAQRRAFRVRDDYPAERRADVERIYASPGFFRGLEPVAGSIEAVREMLALGFDVRICTAPIDDYQHCVVEKYQWIEHHFGRLFTRRMILSKDKTLVAGDWLIDDNPVVKGARVPVWRHAVLDAPYNVESTAQARIRWETWRELLER
jgi:5'-nucleotidase